MWSFLVETSLWYSVKTHLYYCSFYWKSHAIFEGLFIRRRSTLYFCWDRFWYLHPVFYNIWPINCMMPNPRVLHWTIECQQAKTHFLLIVMPCVYMYLCCCKGSYFIRRDLELKSLFTECILVGFHMHNSAMFNDVQYTDKALNPAGLLKYLVYPKRSFHLAVNLLPPSSQSDDPMSLWTQSHCRYQMWHRCWVHSFVLENRYLMADVL